MSQISRGARWCVAVMVVAIGGAAIALDGNTAKATARDDGWRRTADGWELWPPHPATVTKRLAIRSAPAKPLAFPGSAHPAAWAGLQLSLSLLALGFFPSSEES